MLVNLTSTPQVKRILARHDLRPRKRLGQNFLTDRNVLERIVTVSCAGPGANVLEIGTGLGVLTQALAATGARVVSVEADKSLRPALNDTLSDLQGLELVTQDFLKLDLPRFLSSRSTRRWIVAGNLPYYITTPILLRLIDARSLLMRAVVMVQREVAERLTAQPGSPEYGSIGLLMSYHFEITSVMKVSRNVFYPVPDVDSELLLLAPREEPPVRVKDEELMFRVVRAAFGKRRKTLLNALSSSAELGWDKDVAARVVQTSGIDGGRRGETLSLAEFASLADASCSPDSI